MNKTVKNETKQYETPVVQDIEPVTIVQGDDEGTSGMDTPDSPGGM